MARLRSAYEVHLTQVKSYRRAGDAALLRRLARAIRLGRKTHSRFAGRRGVRGGASREFPSDDFVILLEHPPIRKHFVLRPRRRHGTHPCAAGQAQLISLALKGEAGAHAFKDCKPGSFCDETHYPASLFDLVLNLYAIPFTHAGFAPLRQALHEQWEQTLARKKGDDVNSPLKICISYSHMDETFKDELVTMLAGLQRRGIVDAWQDRRIEAGVNGTSPSRTR